MKERPILFSAPMVRAILDGTKTQTRRVVTVPWRKSTRALPYEPWFVEEDGKLLADCSEAADSHGNGDYREFSSCMPCPYGVPGDRLWVRETWNLGRPLRNAEGIIDDEQIWSAPIPKQDPRGKRLFDDWCLGYAADGCEGKMRPSIYMPRWASRITLEVTDVRVQRLQDITEEDARAEGVAPAAFCKAGRPNEHEHVESFEWLWNSINGKRAGCAWDANPWVWAITFRRWP